MDDGECGGDDEVHEVLIKVEFEVVEDEDGHVHPVAASISSHVHNVPLEVAAATLTLVATKILSDHMAHETFGTFGETDLAYRLSSAAAKEFLIDAIRKVPDDLDIISTTVPDDISELLGGE
jgi:hypothetical protein